MLKTIMIFIITLLKNESIMREIIRLFVEICSETLPIIEPIYEFGSYQVPWQIGYADLRPFFKTKEYIGADMREGPGVDVVLDLHQINLPSESVGTVLVLDTFEHVEYPRKAIEELHRILKHDGILVISSHMNFPIHGHPYDYWRFTPEAFRSLLKPFDISFVDFAGQEQFPETVVGIAIKGTIPDSNMAEFMKQMQDWKKPSMSSQQNKLRTITRSFIPPIFLTAYHKIRRY